MISFEFSVTSCIDGTDEYKEFESLYKEAHELRDEDPGNPAEYLWISAADTLDDELFEQFEDVMCEVLNELIDDLKEEISTAKAK